MAAGEDLTGQVFGRWTVVSADGKSKHGKAMWKCICECGKEAVVVGGNLKSGLTRSCGCLWREAMTTHGLSGTPIYQALHSARERVTNPNRATWKDYGGRGITMCDEWLHSAEDFYRDMSQSWKEGLTLERKDVNGNYCPENCEWATESTQGHNKRKRKGCTSQFRGVCFVIRVGKYMASITKDGKQWHLGYFIREVDAATAYDNISEEMYGDRPNGTIKLFEGGDAPHVN